MPTYEPEDIVDDLRKRAAEATRVYGAAYSGDPEFYAFSRTLEAYKEGHVGMMTSVYAFAMFLLCEYPRWKPNHVTAAGGLARGDSGVHRQRPSGPCHW